MERSLTVKEWMFDKIMDAANSYGRKGEMLSEIVRRLSDGSIDRTNHQVTFECFCEIEKETEKAAYVSINQGVWKTWIPKSAIIAA